MKKRDNLPEARRVEVHAVTDAIEAWVADCRARLAKNTLQKIGMATNDFLGYLANRDQRATFGKAMAMAYLDDLSRRRPLMAKMLASKIGGGLRWAVDRDAIESSPWPRTYKFPQPGRREGLRAITEAEYRALLAATANPAWKEPEWRGVLILMWNAGMRVGDACTMRRQSFDLVREELHFVPMKTKRHGTRVSLPLSRELLAWARTLPAEDGLISVRMARHHANGETCGQFRLLADLAGVDKHVSAHSFRRAFVTRAIMAGVSVEIVATLTGHSVDQVREYVKPDMNAKRQAMAEFFEQ